MRISVPLVLEDVIVLDGDEQPVHSLNASDFTVTEDGVPVAVGNFAEHVAPATQQSPIKPLRLPPNTFTNLEEVNPGATLNVLLLDTLNTPLDAQSRVRTQVLNYLKELPPNTQMAIFGLANHLYFLQGFTSDPAVLRTAIEGKRSESVSPFLDDPVSGGPGLSMTDMMDSDDLLPASTLANVQQFEAERETNDTRLRVVYTLEAMNQLARYMSALPGHKNLIWFSGSFPLNIFPDSTLPDPFTAVDDYRDDVRNIADLFGRSRVAVFPVDARGLMVNPAYTASQSTPGPGRSGRMTPTGQIAAITAANHKFFQQSVAEQSTMDLIAAETGGKAFYNSNGLKQAVEQAVNYGQNYYTLAYTPANNKPDGKWRKVRISVDRPGLHVSYRPGYFADSPNYAAGDVQKVLPDNAMHAAMLRGGPDATQVLFDATLTTAEKTTDQLGPDAHPDPKLMKPPYVGYVVRILVDLRTVGMTQDAQGVHQGRAGLVAVVYDRDGVPVNSTFKEVAINIASGEYAAALKNGASAELKIEAPVKGEYFLRIGIEDLKANRVGALEVPVAAIKSQSAESAPALAGK